MEVRGVVEAVTSSPGRGRAQGKTAWSIAVHGESFSVGFRPPAVSVGDLVRFDVKVDGKWKSAWNLQLDGAGSGQGASSPAPEISRPAVAPVAGSVDCRILAAAAIVCTFARITEPGWGIADYIAQVRDVAEKLRA